MTSEEKKIYDKLQAEKADFLKDRPVIREDHGSRNNRDTQKRAFVRRDSGPMLALWGR